MSSRIREVHVLTLDLPHPRLREDTGRLPADELPPSPLAGFGVGLGASAHGLVVLIKYQIVGWQPQVERDVLARRHVLVCVTRSGTVFGPSRFETGILAVVRLEFVERLRKAHVLLCCDRVSDVLPEAFCGHRVEPCGTVLGSLLRVKCHVCRVTVRQECERRVFAAVERHRLTPEGLRVAVCRRLAPGQPTSR